MYNKNLSDKNFASSAPANQGFDAPLREVFFNISFADGTRNEFNVSGPLEIIWNDRRTICVALIEPTADEVLLGAIPIEALDLTINPRKEEITGAHGDQPLHSLK